MMFRKKKEVEKIWIITSDMIRSFMFDKEIFHDDKRVGISGIILGLCCFIVAGFKNKPNIAFDLIEIHKRDLMSEVSKDDLENIVNYINESYKIFRENAIEIQENSNNDIDQVITGLATTTADLICVDKTEEVINAIKKYIFIYINKI